MNINNKTVSYWGLIVIHFLNKHTNKSESFHFFQTFASTFNEIYMRFWRSLYHILISQIFIWIIFMLCYSLTERKKIVFYINHVIHHSLFQITHLMAMILWFSSMGFIVGTCYQLTIKKYLFEKISLIYRMQYLIKINSATK